MPITIVQKNKSKRILTWYARVPDPINKGKVHFFSLGTESKSEAKVILQERIKSGAYEIKPESETMTLGEAAVKFEQYERAKGAKSASITGILYALGSLKALYNKKVSEITAKELSETFVEATKGLSPMTYKNRKTMLSTFFNYLVDKLEVIKSNPVKKAIPTRKIPKSKVNFWTPDQVDRIIAKAPTPKVRLLWSFMAFAGLRKSEAESMRPDMIHEGKIYIKGKGDKEATIPICPRLQREIDRFHGEWKFAHYHKSLKRAARKAIPEGFPGNAHAHRLRHSFISNLIRAGVNIKAVQTLARHESVTLTIDRYGHLLDADVENAINNVFK